MASLTSRPAQPASALSQQEIVDAARPAANIVNWLTSMIRFPDDSLSAVRGAQQTIEDALGCLMLHDYAVVAVPGTMTTLNYDVAVKPFEHGPFVAFHVAFQIQP